MVQNAIFGPSFEKRIGRLLIIGLLTSSIFILFSKNWLFKIPIIFGLLGTIFIEYQLVKTSFSQCPDLCAKISILGGIISLSIL